MSIDETLSASRLGYAKGLIWLKKNISPFEIDSCLVRINKGYKIFHWNENSEKVPNDSNCIQSAFKEDGRWELDFDAGAQYISKEFGILGENESGFNADDNVSNFQEFFNEVYSTGGTAIIPSTRGGGDIVLSDQITIQNKVPPSPVTIQCNSVIRMNSIGEFGTTVLFRNTKDTHWIGGIIDGGSAEGVLGNNGFGISGIASNGDQRSENITISNVTMRNCVMDPFLKGGKGWTVQSGSINCGFTECVIQDCDIGFGYESTFDEVGDRIATKGFFTNSVIKDCKYTGAWLHQGSGYSNDPDFFSLILSDLIFENCGDPEPVTWESNDLSGSVITKADHGFFSRDSVLFTEGTGTPGGLTNNTRYYVLRLNDNDFQLVSSASRVINAPNTSISSNANWVNAIGHQFLTSEGVKYIQGATGVGGLTTLTTYYVVRNAYNYFQLTAAAANISEFEAGDVNTGTDEITITGHPFSTGDAVKLSIGTPSSATAINSQLEFELSGGSAYSGSVRPGTTLNNDEYRPETTYYVIKVDADTVKLARTSAEATAGTAINITKTGAGTMGICLASNIVDITSQGTGYQTFGIPITISNGGSGTHTLQPDGWAPIIWDRAEYINATNIQIVNRGSSRAQTICWGRCANTSFEATAYVNNIKNAWNFNTHGTRGEFGDPGSVPSINNTIDFKQIQIDRELYEVTGNTDGSTGVITNVISADLARVAVGDSVTVSAGFATTGPFTVTAKSSTDNTLTVDSNSNSAQSGVTVTRQSSITTPLIVSSSVSGVDLRQSNINLTVAGFPISIDIINPVPDTLRYKLNRAETGESISGVGQTVAGTNPRFSAAREQQSQSIPFVIGDFYFDDDGTYANLRTVNNKTLALCDSGGVRNARSTTSRFRTESSSWNGRNFGIGNFVFWFDSSKNFRCKEGTPSSESDGVIISAAPVV